MDILPLQSIQNLLCAGRAFFGIHLQHLLQQRFEVGIDGWVELRSRSEEKWLLAWVNTGQQVMKQSSKAIDIRTRRALCLSILFGCRISWRAKRDSIMLFARLENTRNAEIDQIEMTIFADHHIGRFQVAKDD